MAGGRSGLGGSDISDSLGSTFSKATGGGGGISVVVVGGIAVIEGIEAVVVAVLRGSSLGSMVFVLRGIDVVDVSEGVEVMLLSESVVPEVVLRVFLGSVI